MKKLGQACICRQPGCGSPVLTENIHIFQEGKSVQLVTKRYKPGEILE